MASLDILIADDEPRIRSTLSICLERDNHHVMAVGSAEEALHAAIRRAFDLVFLDLRLGAVNGLDLIPKFLAQSPWLKIVVITAYASVESAVEAMKRGAVDYLPKPFSPDQVRLLAHKVAEARMLEARVETLKDHLSQAVPEAVFESKNPAMNGAIRLARQVAQSDATVLIRGESGTGKGVFAQAIHAWSKRADKPFAVVHCPSLPTELIENELFGHVRGAFTGAVNNSPGRIALCDGGTLFLDEIAELPMDLQSKLLRFVQDRQYERVGDPITRTADVRILAATNQDLEAAIQSGRFREDLFYRLNVIEIEIPPLCQRPEDILVLADQFLAFFARKHNRSVLRFTDEAREAIQNYNWPGHVRELQNAIERAVILCSTDQISPHSFPFHTVDPHKMLQVGGSATLSKIEEEHIRRVLNRATSLEEAAQILGIDPSTLWRRRKHYGI